MSDFPTDLRARLLRLEGAAPDIRWRPAPAATAAPRTHGKRTVAAVGLLSLAMLASAAVAGAPAVSRGTYESQLRDFGVPAGAEVVAFQVDADGNFITVMYRDSSGHVVTLGGIERLHTPPPTP
jgi:hypothetical protein